MAWTKILWTQISRHNIKSTSVRIVSEFTGVDIKKSQCESKACKIFIKVMEEFTYLNCLD